MAVGNFRRTLIRPISLTSYDRGKIGTIPDNKTTGILPSLVWSVERVFATCMIALYPVALYINTPMMDFLVVSAISLHSYWGFDGIIKDYAFERRYGPLLMPVLRSIWKVMAALGYAGFLYFNYNDIGFITAVKELWSL